MKRRTNDLLVKINVEGDLNVFGATEWADFSRHLSFFSVRMTSEIGKNESRRL